jgi:hypothetical protein
VSDKALRGEVVTQTWLQGELYSVYKQQSCVHTRRLYMEKMQGEPRISEDWHKRWTLEKQGGYTVPDFVHQVETAWKELNNITPKKPGKNEWE